MVYRFFQANAYIIIIIYYYIIYYYNYNSIP